MKKNICLVLFLLMPLITSVSGFEVLTNNRNPASEPFRWPESTFPVVYNVEQSGTPDISGTSEFKQIEQSIAIWNRISKLKFRYQGTTQSVSFGDLKNGVIFDKNFLLGSNVLAYMETVFFTSDRKTRVEGDLHFNDEDFKWTTGASDPSKKVYKVLAVALHEFGHSVGLDHSAVKKATMFYSFQGDQFSTLDKDDKKGAKFIYNNPRLGSVPKPLTPLNKTTHTLSKTGQAARGITFAWTQNPGGTLTSFVLKFGSNAALTQNVKLFNMGTKTAGFLKGKKIKALETIQQNSPEQRVYWIITATGPDGKTVSSALRWLKIERE